MKKAIMAAALIAMLLLTGCGAPQISDEELVSIYNDVVEVSREDVLKIESGMTYRQLFTALGPTQDVGSGLHVATYLVDGKDNLLISYTDLDGLSERTGEEMLASLVSAVNIRGKVTELSETKDGIVMLVEADATWDGEYDIATVRADANTRVEDMGGNALLPRDVALGDAVEVVFSGPVAESYPVQAYAGSIRIIL